MRHYIITGASRGIGNEMAKKLATDGNCLHLIARSNMDELVTELTSKGALVKTYEADLSRPEVLAELNGYLFKEINEDTADHIVLVNNAGMLEPMGMIGTKNSAKFLANLQVNFTSAVMMCQLFMEQVQDWDCEKRIMNISSGAANRPYPGWSHYCSTKAGLNMFTSCITEEQKAAKKPVKAAAYNPGRTDTKMQEEIREQNSDDFPFAQSFVDAWKDGVLNDPVKVAEHIVNTINAKRYPTGEIVKFNG